MTVIPAWASRQPRRFQQEMDLLAQHAPNMVAHILDGDTLAFEEVVQFRETGNRYHIAITVSEGYPAMPPSGFILNPPAFGHHVFHSDGRLCLHEPGETSQGTSVLVVRGWTLDWIRHFAEPCSSATD